MATDHSETKKIERSPHPRALAGGKNRHAARKAIIAGVELLAGGDQPITLPSIRSAGIADYAHFLTKASMLPWLTIELVGQEQWIFIIDRNLKELCELYEPRPQLGGMSFVKFMGNLRREITRRRTEANYRRARAHNRWSPDSVNKVELCQLVDWIERELDKIGNLKPGQSANVQEDAVTTLNAARENNNGYEDQLRAGSADTRTGPEICADEAATG